ncbi:hypothetical protein [Moorena sp. SIO3I6]|nr:hypothetical protein [Moorena sp. SIO3I6]
MRNINFQACSSFDKHCPPYINYSLLPTPYSLMIKIAQDQY